MILPFATSTSSGIALAPDAPPSYRGHGPSGPLGSVYGTAAPLGTGSAVTGATNASPVVVTAAGHGLVSGDVVVVSGVLGNTAANGTWTVAVTDANTFSLTASTGNAAYTGGGTFSLFGMWEASFDVTEANGFIEGDNYTVELTWTNGGNTYKRLLRFGVG